MPQVQGRQSNKGNPAHHRMSNTALKTRREHSWRLGQVRKELRAQAQREREQANKVRRLEGKLTPWEIARRRRRTAREAAGVRERWLRRQSA